MIEDKKIENLFKDNQHKLDEMPSPMAWDRLEVRLEKHALTRKRFAWRRLAVAAAVFIAVSMIGLWTYINPLGSTMNKTTILFPKKELASEIIAGDAPAPARPILMSHREKVQYLTEVSNTRMNTRPALALRENKSTEKTTNISPAKSIRPQVAKPKPQADITPSITTTDMTVQADVEPIVEEKIIQKLEEKDIVIIGNASDEKDDSYKIIADEVAANQAVVVESTTPTMPTTISTTSGYSRNTDVNDAEIAPQYDIESEVEESVVIEEVTAKETKKKHRARRSADKSAATKDVRSESIPAPVVAAKPKAEPDLDRFDWLLGKWTDEDDNSFEEWQRIAPNILEGKGYFVVDVDTTFTQSMKIVQSNAQVFFMVDGQAVEGKFELEQYDDGSATFKNKDEANEQITLKKDANNAYSVTIEKTKKQIAREKRKKKRTFKRVKE